MSWHDIMPTQGALSNLLRKLQVKGVEKETYNVVTFPNPTFVIALHFWSPGQIRRLSPIYGLILISDWHQRDRDDSLVINDPIPDLYFARQVNINACATSAILSIIMNCPEVDIGPLLSELKEQTKDLSPAKKGLRINSNEAMRTAHNSLANMIANHSNPEEQRGYNFVSYLPIDGVLYELDGQKLGPIRLGKYSDSRTDEFWLEMALSLIKEQVVKNGKNRCRWTLLAFIENEVKVFSTELEEMLKAGDQLTRQHPASPGQEREMMEVKQRYQNLRAKKTYRHILIKGQSAKINHSAWAKAYESYLEHDYIPFAINLLKLLAENKKLKPLIADAKQKQN